MNTFYFIAGPIAAGKTTFMDNKLYLDLKKCNFFDHDKTKLMIQLYGDNKNIVNEIELNKSLVNAIEDSLKNKKDFMMQIHFTDEQLPQINTFLHKYKSKFIFESHFIIVDNIDTLKIRANKREKLGGHTSGIKSIDKTFKQSFSNFIKYLEKLNKTTIWDNSKEFGFSTMEPQLIFEKNKLIFKNNKITSYVDLLLKMTEKSIKNKIFSKVKRRK
jgi:predicted ABC-type ATPase